MYPEEIVQPMKEELTEHGFEELLNKEDVESQLKKEGTTLKNFILQHKIDRVKQLILCDELNLTDIAWKLNYSSVGHLSTQFLKITGATPSLFKSIEHREQTVLANQ